MVLGDWRKSGFLFASLLSVLAGLASAQCPQSDGTVTGGLKTYPLASDRYGVQYSINGGASTTAMVYISYYGQTTGSPYANVSGYTAGIRCPWSGDQKRNRELCRRCRRSR